MDPTVQHPTTSSNQPQSGTRRVNVSIAHFKTPRGILLLVQFVIGILTFALWPPIWLSIIAWPAWMVTILLIVVYIFSLFEYYTGNPPFKILEFYFFSFVAITLVFCSIFCFIFPAWWIGGLFGILNACAYGVSAFLLFPEWRAHRTQN